MSHCVKLVNGGKGCDVLEFGWMQMGGRGGFRSFSTSAAMPNSMTSYKFSLSLVLKRANPTLVGKR